MRKLSFVALLIVLLIFIAINIKAITKTITEDSKNSASETKSNQNVEYKKTKNNNNNINIIDASTKMVNENISIKFMLTNTTKMKKLNEIVINTAKPSDFNKSSLEQHETQQKQHQRNYKHEYTLYNQHPPCDYVEHTNSIVTSGIENNSNIINTARISRTYNNNNKNYIHATTTTLQINATANGYKPLLIPNTSNSVDTTTSTAAMKVNNNGINNNVPLTLLSASTSSPSPSSSTFNVARNGFRDKINISNQRNEFTSEVDEDDVVFPIAVESSRHVYDTIPFKTATQGQLVQSALRQAQNYNFNSSKITISHINNNTNSATNNYIIPATSTFFENVELVESTLSPDKRHELLLHRRKRYLLFPEGSSFQLVFDLIIGMVDYSSYLILGITCAVAWELPSKPPGDIIENFRDKLNEGTFGYQRRNDSIADKKLQYVDTHNENPASKTTTIATPTEPMQHINYKYESPWNSQKYENIGNYYQQKYATKVPTTTPIVMNYYGYKDQHEHRTEYEDNIAPAAAGTSDIGFTGAQRKTLNEKASQFNWYWNRPEPERAYMKYNKKYYTKPKDEWSNNDKWKYSAGATTNFMPNLDWRRQGTSVSDNHDRHDDYIADSVRYDERQQQRNYAGWRQKDNWWQANRQRFHDKQHQWTQYEAQRENSNSYTSKRPINVYATPTYSNSNNYQRTGRQRKILKALPNHRIYPVFGRKKRSLESDSSPFELELERIHFREQLQSRQKLYGKIEQLFQTRGHNGTACVLRALCETGQRHQLPLHHRHHGRSQRHSRQHQSYHDHQQQEPHSTTDQLSGPQSFITELLRAIFALPKDILRSREFEYGAMHPHPDHARTSTTTTKALELLQREFEAHISWHYRDAHAYAGDCAERFASCEHSIWNDGIKHGGVVVGRAFKM